jgi:hypothetical protein
MRWWRIVSFTPLPLLLVHFKYKRRVRWVLIL